MSAHDHKSHGPRHYEVWSGADVSTHVWLIYSGATLAPFSDMHEDGLRLRAAGGYGQYQYVNNSKHEKFQADTNFTDALIGYLKRMGPLTAKAFIGISAIDHIIEPYDIDNNVKGAEFGLKGVIELWLNIDNNAWASLDLAWAQAHNTRSVRTRIGYRVWPNLSIGLEAGINIDEQAHHKITKYEYYDAEPDTALDYARGGAFARYEWCGGEISVSGGLLGDFTEHTSPYATVNWIKQF